MKEPKRHLIALVESPDGTTYEQEIEFVKDIKTSIKIAKSYLGRGYWICQTYWREY